MTLEQVLSEISSLTPSEHLKIAQVIWDRLPDEFGTDISPAQQAELDRRWIEYKKDPSRALTLEEFRERMRVARGKWSQNLPKIHKGIFFEASIGLREYRRVLAIDSNQNSIKLWIG
jgi:putative addiction module component (TIGR02574 family)